MRRSRPRTRATSCCCEPKAGAYRRPARLEKHPTHKFERRKRQSFPIRYALTVPSKARLRNVDMLIPSRADASRRESQSSLWSAMTAIALSAPR